MRVRREVKPAMLLRNDHAEEFMLLDEVPDFRRQVAPFPINLPVVEHGAELIDRAVEEGLFLGRKRSWRVGQELRRVRVAGEDIAGLKRLALGVRHGRQYAAGPGEDRLGDEIAAEAHGELLMVGGEMAILA